MAHLHAIYLAGGIGKRMGLSYPKQFAKLSGVPIIIHGLQTLLHVDRISDIFMVLPPSLFVMHHQFDEFREYLSQYVPLTKKVHFVPGGTTRQESVFNALKEVQSEHVLVAESARPFITEEFVQRIIETESDFVTPFFEFTSSVLAHDPDKGISWPFSRDKIGEIQTPQKFRTSLLLKAHRRAPHIHHTDDVNLVIRVLGSQPTVIIGLEENIKITTPLDLHIMEVIYNARHSDRL